jgi:hypothetical protein
VFSSQVRSATWIGEPKLFTIDPNWLSPAALFAYLMVEDP